MNPSRAPLLAEWACLGALYEQPSHGFAVSKRLALDGDLGRVWHVSRPLTYRALEQLRSREWIESKGEETGEAGPNRTLVAATQLGRSQFGSWIATPVAHVRDVRVELLLKVVLARELNLDVEEMLQRQCDLLNAHVRSLAVRNDGDVETEVNDVVLAWRREMTLATYQFVSSLLHDQKRRPLHSSR